MNNRFILKAQPANVRLEREKTGLVIVDGQNAFSHDKGFLATITKKNPHFDMNRMKEVVPRIQELVEIFRKREMAIIWLMEGYAPDGTDRKPTTHDLIGTEGPLGRYLIRGSQDFALVDGLKPQPGESIVVKPGKNPFLSPPKDNWLDLEQLLLKKGINHLLIGGGVTSVCVNQVGTGAAERGFFPILAEDCCGDGSESAHRETLQKFGHQQQKGKVGIFGNSTNLDEIRRAMM